MANHNTVPAFVAGLLFGAVSGFGQGLPSPLPPPPPPVSILPPVGLVSSETAQVNIANPAAFVYNSAGEVVVCAGTLTFYHASGSAIGTATSFTIVNAQILSFKLPYASTGATDPRAVVWAAVNFTGGGSTLKTGFHASPSTPPCTLASSIETYDSITGITHAFASVPAQTDATVVRVQDLKVSLPVSAIAIVPCEIYRLDVGQAHAAAQRDHGVADFHRQALKRDLCNLAAKHLELRGISPVQRLEGLLWDLAAVLGGPEAPGTVRLVLPLSNQEMADLCGLSESHYKKVRRDLEASGRFRRCGRRAWILGQRSGRLPNTEAAASRSR